MKVTALFFAAASLCLFTSNSFAANDGPKTLVNPEWEFFDDFEGTRDNSFWKGNGVSANYGVERPDATSKVLEMVYEPNSEGNGDSWSEYDFNLAVNGVAINAVQVEVSFKMFTPSNYVPIENNQKIFYLWSGLYGHGTANFIVGYHAWGNGSVALPSLTSATGPLVSSHVWSNDQIPVWETGTGETGEWSTYQFFLELATDPTDYGIMEFYKDGELLIATYAPNLNDWGWTGNSSPGFNGNELIKYAPSTINNGGNFVDQGTLLGWANGDPNGGFLVDTKFLIDDFRIRANSEFGAVEVVPELPGDFDNDEDVDGADFLQWQRDPSVGNLSDWEANFGALSAVSAAASVPEPVSGVVAAIFALMAITRGSRHRRFDRSLGTERSH